MLEDYDPYLSTFIQDVGTGISTIIQTIELLIGVGYFIGGKTVEGLKWSYETSAFWYNEISTAVSVFRDEAMEFGGSFVRAVLLIYYGVCKIFESFYITAVDLRDFCFHFKDSIWRTISQTSTFMYTSVTGIFTGAPQQLIDALSIIGETAVAAYHGMVDILCDFLVQIIVSPIKVVLLVFRTLVQCIKFPFQLIFQMPMSSILGLCVILIFFYASRKLLRYLVLRNILLLLSGVLRGFLKLLSFIRLTRLRNLIASSVWTVANLQDYDTGGSCKAACVVCQDKPVCFMSNPCKHVCLCDVCVHDLIQHDSRCPICRRQVSKYDRVFIP